MSGSPLGRAWPEYRFPVDCPGCAGQLVLVALLDHPKGADVTCPECSSDWRISVTFRPR